MLNVENNMTNIHESCYLAFSLRHETDGRNTAWVGQSAIDMRLELGFELLPSTHRLLIDLLADFLWKIQESSPSDSGGTHQTRGVVNRMSQSFFGRCA